MNHESHLRKLLTLIVKEPQESEPFSFERGFLSGEIPRELLTKENMDSENPSLILTGDEMLLFHESVKTLRKDIKTEYLKDNEIKDRLWFLVCEVWNGRQTFKDSKKLKTKINDFIESICKPLDEYEVIFKVHNLELKKRIKIWDCFIVNYSKNTLKRKGFRDTNIYFLKIINDFEKKSLILVPESGNNYSLATERARKKANEVIKLLQTYLSAMPGVANEQLLFSISEEYAIKRRSDSKLISTGWKRDFLPISFDYEDSFLRLTKKANKHYKLIENTPEKLQNCVKRAILWIGKAISEEDFDLKVAFLCTALETLLTTKQDGRKGEKIAYRTALLRKHFEKTITHPRFVLQLYLTRNDVVHGSKIGIASKPEYHSLLRLTNETLDYFIRLISKRKLKRQPDVLNLLIKSKYAPNLLNWLRLFSDANSKEIAKALDEDLNNIT
jgi:hypothetical protein